MTTKSADLTELDALMKDRHSCRAFRPDPVDREVIEQILRCAQKVPSWCNAQPWKVTITSGAETDRLRNALTEAAMAGEAHSGGSWGCKAPLVSELAKFLQRTVMPNI